MLGHEDDEVARTVSLARTGLAARASHPQRRQATPDRPARVATQSERR